MDRREVIREKLSELTSESAQRHERWSYEWRQQFRGVWRRFQTFSVLERTFIAGCALLAMILIPAGLIVLSSGGGGGNDAAAASRPRPSPTAAAPIAGPTVVDPNLGPTPTPYRVSVRQNCDLIRGTEYRSDLERQWFEAHCLEPTPEPTEAAPTATPHSTDGGNQPPPPPPPTQAPPPPPTEDVFTSNDAIAAAASWMSTGTGAVYAVDQGSCNAVSTGGHWVVTCSVSLLGCHTAACAESLSACVYADADSVRVVPTTQC